MISEKQDLLLNLIEKNSFNSFDGPTVVRDLRAHRNLWRSVLMHHQMPLLSLRDLPDNHYHADTLYIHAEPGQQHRLEDIASTWNADEVHWMH